MQRPIEPKNPPRDKIITYEVLKFNEREFGDRCHVTLISGIMSFGFLFSGASKDNFIWFPLLLLVYFIYNLSKMFYWTTKFKTILKDDVEYNSELADYKIKIKDYRTQLELYEKERQNIILKQQEIAKQKQKEINRQQILAEQKKIAEQRQRELEEKQKELSKALIWRSKINKLKEDFKTEWEEFQKVIKSNRIEKLYHFTDRSNITSIKTNGGLYSWWSAQQNGISIPKPGGVGFGRDLDVRKGLQNYVRLSFNNRNPMLFVVQKEGRVLDPVFLEIDPVVLFLKKTLFTKENATKNGIYPNASLEFFKEIVEGSETGQSSIIRELLGSSYLINPKAEILVFEKVPLEFIMNINDI